MDFKGIMLHEINQSTADFTYMWTLKNITNEQTKENKPHRKQIGSCQRGSRRWVGLMSEEGKEVQMTSYKISHEDNVQRNDCSQYCNIHLKVAKDLILNILITRKETNLVW